MSDTEQPMDVDFDPARDRDPELHPYQLDAQLKRDCIVLGRFSLCDLLLMNDANYPWFILVPRRADVSEIYHLSNLDQQQLLAESSLLSSNLADIFNADKMNVAALGNVVKQLHLHHVVRYQDDPAWPAPVWGKLAARAYSAEQIDELRERVNGMLADGDDYQPQGS